MLGHVVDRQNCSRLDTSYLYRKMQCWYPGGRNMLVPINCHVLYTNVVTINLTRPSREWTRKLYDQGRNCSHVLPSLILLITGCKFLNVSVPNQNDCSLQWSHCEVRRSCELNVQRLDTRKEPLPSRSKWSWLSWWFSGMVIYLAVGVHSAAIAYSFSNDKLTLEIPTEDVWDGLSKGKKNW